MNSTLRTIATRYSCRSYTGEPVEQEKLEAIALAAVCTYVSFVSSSGNGVPSILGIRMFSIQTDSMYPTFDPGDLVVGMRADPQELRKDDIITYWTVINGEREPLQV